MDVIFPNEPWKMMWDFMMLLAIVYSCVTVPFRLGMVYPATGSWWIFEAAITIFFIVDLLFTFKVAVADGSNALIINRNQIQQRYQEFWLWIDAASSCPVELIEVSVSLLGMDDNESSDFRLLKLLRALRLLRLLRLLKILKLQAIVQIFEMRSPIPVQYLQLIKMVGGILYLMHVFGCGWYYLHFCEVENAAVEGREAVSWLTEYGDGRGPEQNKWVQYLDAIYWALTTLTTVGYGDVVPHNNMERAYTLVVLLVGAIVFGFLLSSLGELLSNVDPTRVRIDEKMNEVKQFLSWHSVPMELTLAVRRYYDYYLSHRFIANEEELLNNLTPSLKRAVLTHLLGKTVARIPLFASSDASYVSLDFQLQVHPMLKPIVREAKEVILEKGKNDGAIHFLSRGSITATGDLGMTFFELHRQGACFGENALMHETSWFTFVAKIRSEIFSISVSDFAKLAKGLPLDSRDELAESILDEFLKHTISRNVALRLCTAKVARQLSSAAERAALRLQRNYHAHYVSLLAGDDAPMLDQLMPMMYGRPPIPWRSAQTSRIETKGISDAVSLTVDETSPSKLESNGANVSKDLRAMRKAALERRNSGRARKAAETESSMDSFRSDNHRSDGHRSGSNSSSPRNSPPLDFSKHTRRSPGPEGSAAVEMKLMKMEQAQIRAEALLAHTKELAESMDAKVRALEKKIDSAKIEQVHLQAESMIAETKDLAEGLDAKVRSLEGKIDRVEGLEVMMGSVLAAMGNVVSTMEQLPEKVALATRRRSMAM